VVRLDQRVWKLWGIGRGTEEENVQNEHVHGKWRSMNKNANDEKELNYTEVRKTLKNYKTLIWN
jgi:hypothetical protein